MKETFNEQINREYREYKDWRSPKKSGGCPLALRAQCPLKDGNKGNTATPERKIRKVSPLPPELPDDGKYYSNGDVF